MIGNIIVVLAVCGAAFYLYRQWKKVNNSDSPACAGCDACKSNQANRQATIFESPERASRDQKDDNGGTT